MVVGGRAQRRAGLNPVTHLHSSSLVLGPGLGVGSTLAAAVAVEAVGMMRRRTTETRGGAPIGEGEGQAKI